jgi:pyruvate,water dikinase
MVDDVKFTLIGGWIYMQIQPTGAPPPKHGSSGRTPPRWLLALAMRLHPAVRRRAKIARTAIQSDLAGTYRAKWREEWRSELADDIERALDRDLTALSDDGLVAEFDHRFDVARRAALMHTRLGVAVTLPLYRLTVTCRRLLGWDDRQTLELLEGLSDASTSPARLITALVEMAGEHPELADMIVSSRPDLDKIRATHPEFAAAFDDYVMAVGHRALEYDPESPTLAETPHILLGVIASHLQAGIDPEAAQRSVAQRRKAAEQRAREELGGQSDEERAEFEERLTEAQSAYPVREDNEWYTTSTQIALLRYLVLELGRRLADRGRLASSDDVYFVEYPDLRDSLLDGHDLHKAVSENKARWAWAMAHRGPDVYGQTVDFDPPIDALPPKARLVNEASLWSLATTLGGDPEGQIDGALTGVAASAGRFTGPARIVHGEEDFSKIQPGDVVVCPATSPVWSIVFPSMGALVTDSGGVLSHPAIIAREHGIPAVVGTSTGTTTYRDGEIITVDGDAGRVQHADIG